MKLTDKLILGTVQLGIPYGINNHTGQPDRMTAHQILRTAWEKGIRLLDTAESYGSAQEVIGDFHAAQNNRFEVITKLRHGKEPGSVIPSLINDIKMMKVESLYGFMFHDLELFKRNATILKDLTYLKGQGKIQRIGVSVYSNEEIEFILNYPEVNLLQMPFNMLDNWCQRGEYLRRAKGKGIEIHVRSVFLQGLFFIPLSELPLKLNALKPYLIELHTLCSRQQISIEMAAMAYALSKPEIDRVLLGVETPDQLSSNLNQISQLKVSDDFFEAVDAIQVGETEFLSPVNW